MSGFLYSATRQLTFNFTAGVDPAADLACIGSAAGTAAGIDDCKNCIVGCHPYVQLQIKADSMSRC